MNALLALALGVASGLVQVLLLRRQVRSATWAAGFFVRYGLVALALLTAAKGGALLPASVGWLFGYLVTTALAMRSLQ